jgi:hypothetical protein
MRVVQTPDAIRYVADAAQYYALNLAWLRGILVGDFGEGRSR